MSSSEANTSTVEKKGKEVEGSMPSDATAVAGTNAHSDCGLRGGWRGRLMNWRNDGSSSTGSHADGKDSATTSASAPVAFESLADKVKEQEQPRKDGDQSSATVHADDASAASISAAADVTKTGLISNTLPARPMNIWLRRALERQAESAIAEAIRDGKRIPEAAVATLASVASKVPAAPLAEAVAAEAEIHTATPSATETATTTATPKMSFAELMRQHREGLLPPTAQPPVKATKVVKRPKAADPPAAVLTTATEKKSSSPTIHQGRADKGSVPPHTTPKVQPAGVPLSEAEDRVAIMKERGGEGVQAQTACAKEADTGATPSPAAVPVHQAVVRKRTKTTNNASVKRTQDTGAPTSATATPTHVTTVKGRASLEELRARRNRTTAGGTAAHHNTPLPGEGGADAAISGSSGSPAGMHSQADEYNDSALDAVSRLLLRYCLGSRPAASSPSIGAAATADDASQSRSPTEPATAPTAESLPASTQTPTELDFFDELMGLCEDNSITPASLELLRELFQHVRVFHRPADVSCDGDASAAAEVDVESYRVAARRREYVQQVIMVLLNRLKHMKTQEQQRKRQKDGGAAAAPAATATPAATSAPPQLVTGDGVLFPHYSSPQQQQSGMLNSQEKRMAFALPWRETAAMASGVHDGAAVAGAGGAGAASFTPPVTNYGYSNPYAHLTVFSQHQPVAPPLDWPQALCSSTTGAYCDPYGHYGGINQCSSSVAARLVASPFPGAFPIIPPPAPTDTGAETEDRELQELFRIIRAQLTQPVNKNFPSMGTIDSRVEPDAKSTGAAPVEVSQAERAVLRHVQHDFKRHMEQQQQAVKAGGVSDDPSLPPLVPQAASTPPTTGLVTPQLTSLSLTTGDAVDIDDCTAGVTAGTTTGVSAAVRSDSERDPCSSTPLLDQDRAAQRKGESAGGSPPVRRSTAPTHEGSHAAGEMTPIKSHITVLSFNAKPFVPGGVCVGGVSNATATAIAPTATVDSTPTKTTFNYHAKPFLPSTNATSPMLTSPPKNTQMNAAAPAFIPKGPHPHATVPSSVAAPPVSGAPLNASSSASTALPLPSPLPPGGAVDPWVSYEMFARWRDMMESYYQNVFATQSPAAAAAGVSLSPATSRMEPALLGTAIPTRPV